MCMCVCVCVCVFVMGDEQSEYAWDCEAHSQKYSMKRFLSSKYTRALTFENVCQAGEASGTRRAQVEAKVSAAAATERRTSSRVGSLVTPLLRRSRASHLSTLHPSSATLIVVPATLIDHWKFQITAHTREGVLRVLSVTKPSEIRPAAQMAEYDVVLTTFDVLSKQWAVGSPTPGSDRWYKLNGTIGRGSQSWRFSPAEYTGVGAETQLREGLLSSPAAAVESSEFQLVRWVRVVLDEGHVMGASCDTNRALMLGSISAGAKWICTGTPAPSTPAAELQHMHGLISALGVQPYGHPEVWRSLIHAPFEMHDLGAWIRLHALLSRIMIRSVKADMERLGEIPTCTVLTTELELSRPEKRAYNSLMTIIKRNLVLSECGGSRVDSLLHQKNRKFALEAINNARKACCVTGQFNLEIVRAHLDECIRDMRRGHSLHEV
jgi:SNF2 family DNA or RNA helicase